MDLGGTEAGKLVLLIIFLIIHEEKELILLDGAPDGAAINVRVQYRVSIGQARKPLVAFEEPFIGVERRVAEEFKSRPMEVVGSGPSNHIHVGAWIATVTGVVTRRLNLELRNRIRIGHGKRAIQCALGDAAQTHVVVNRDAILQIGVLTGRTPIDRHVCGALANCRGITHVGADARRHR